MRSWSALSLALFTCASLTACGDDDASRDAGGADSGTPDSGEIDANVPDASGPSTLFGPCTMDSQCPGAGALCRSAVGDGFSGGQCTVPCEPPDRGPCDDGDIYHLCVAQMDGSGVCEERCLSGNDCTREGYSCAGVGSFGGEFGICVPVCASDDECGSGTTCNRYSGRCVTAAAAGSTTGGTCGDDPDCQSGQCIVERSGLTPSGWNGGYCIGPCILPPGYNSSTFFGEPALPQGTCIDGDICFPNGSLTRGDIGVCLAGCDSDADCRAAEGYTCRKSFATAGGTNTFTNGVCFKIDCATAACPAGYTCRMVRTGSGTDNVCERM